MRNVVVHAWLVETLERFTALPVLGIYLFILAFGAAAGLVHATFGAGVPILRRHTGPLWPFAVAAWMVVCEFWLPQFFPHSDAGVWISVPSFFLVSATTGLAGVTFIVFSASAVAALAIDHQRNKGSRDSNSTRHLRFATGAVAIMLVIALSLAQWQLRRIEAAESRADSFRVAMVQDNLERGEARERFRGNMVGHAERLVALSRRALLDDPSIDVVLWSEGALRSAPNGAWGTPARLFTQATGVEVWTGAVTRYGKGEARRSYNSAFRIVEGEVSAPYHKNHLVPISEKMPLSEWLPSLAEMVGTLEGAGTLSPGTELGVFETPWAKTAFVICYEAILREPMLRAAQAGADLFTNFTYEGWFGNTRELDLHLVMARSQVAQLGVPMVRVATTGITSILDARGQVVQQGGRFTEEVVVGDARPLRAPGLYARIGPWFAWSCTMACAAAFARAWRDRKAPQSNE